MEQFAQRHAGCAVVGELSRTSERRRQLDLNGAVDFLVAAQGRDGTWSDFLTLAGPAVCWPTAYVAAALPATAATARQRASLALLAMQDSDGGWGYHAGVPADADTTAYVLALLASDELPSQAVRAKACQWLASAAGREGGFATYPEAEPIRGFMALPPSIDLSGWTQPCVEVTAAAARGLHMASGRHAEHVEAACTWLLLRQGDDGRWPAYWWTTDLYASAQVARLLQSFPNHPGVSAALAAARRHAVRTQSADGAWADGHSGVATAFATACGLATVGPGPAADAARAWLAAAQRPDGSWDCQPMLRIPPPMVTEPLHWRDWRVNALGTGVVLRDEGRLYTTATVLHAVCALADAAG